MSFKRKASAMAAAPEEPVDPSDELMFLCLGGGNEVGRSCHIIQYKGKTVMLDAGQHPAYDGLASLPFFDDFDLSTVDVLLISHFHVDHAASLPYVLAKTNFRGRVFMTHPTKAIYKWLIQDSVRVGNTSSNPTSQPVYTEQDHLSTFRQIEAIDYHTTHTVSSIRITPYPAGHVLGAAMFLVEIAGLKIFFTGDYSRELDRHLVSATVPKGLKIDVLITESTYGIASHVPRLEREQALMKSITGILNRGGRVLMPVFALGRAQELLLILDEYWSKHQDFQHFPIYYASNLAKKCMVVYQTYTGAMNDNIKRLYAERAKEAEASGNSAGGGGPWDFRFIRSLKNLDRFEDVGGCVMLASPGMLQNGVSRELLERWAPSDKNGVIITGYSVEGTMAKQIMQEPDHIQAVMSRSMASGGGRRALGGGAGANGTDKVLIPRRCSVQEFSFAAHVDGTENREFIEEVNAPVVILVHGEQHNMMRLKSKLLSLNAGKAEQDKMKVFSPRNCEELRIPFKKDKIAKVVGKLGSIPPPMALLGGVVGGQGLEKEEDDDKKLQQMNGGVLTGVLVQNDFKLSLMAPEDLHEYAGLTTTTIICRQRLTLSAAGIDLIKWSLQSTFGAIEELPEMQRQQRQRRQRKQIHADKGENGASVSTANGKTGEAKNGTGNGVDSDDRTDGSAEGYDAKNGHSKGEIDVEEMMDGLEEMKESALNPKAEGIKDDADADADADDDDDDYEPGQDDEQDGFDGNQDNVDDEADEEDYEEEADEEVNRLVAAYLVMGCISVRYFSNCEIELEWEGNMLNDGIADAVMAVLFSVESSPAAVKQSGKNGHSHSHEHTPLPLRNVHANVTPEEQFSRLCMFLEAQFGADNVSPIAEPRLPQPARNAEHGGDGNGDGTDDEDSHKQALISRELERLHAMGIPVPGVLVKVDKMEAKVWLDDLEIECAQRVFGDRVRAVVERAVEVTAPLWR